MNRPGASSAALLVAAVLAFVSLGLPDGTLGVAWPSMRGTFAQPIRGLGTLLAAGAVGYLLSSTQSGHLLARLGVGRLLLISTVLTASSSLGFAVAPHWSILVLLAVVAGLGAGAIDAGTNAFAAHHFSPATVNGLHACYGLGAAAGPLLMTTVLAAQLPWQVGYGLQAVLLGALAVYFARVARHWSVEAPREATEPVAGGAAGRAARLRDALTLPVVWLSAASFLLYAGLEASAGQWAYSLLVVERDWETAAAGSAVSLYWASLTGGRVAGVWLARRLSATALVRLGLSLAPVGALLLMFASPPEASALALVLLGVGLAPIFPSLIADTPRRAGSHLAAHAVSLEVSASYVGIALLPTLVGRLAERTGLEVLGPALLVALVLLAALHEAALASVRRTGA